VGWRGMVGVERRGAQPADHGGGRAVGGEKKDRGLGGIRLTPRGGERPNSEEVGHPRSGGFFHCLQPDMARPEQTESPPFVEGSFAHLAKIGWKKGSSWGIVEMTDRRITKGWGVRHGPDEPTPGT
jgi:hypothetical protein